MQGISQVSIAVNDMDGVTQNNAVLVEKSSYASQSLSAQAHCLREAVSALRIQALWLQLMLKDVG